MELDITVGLDGRVLGEVAIMVDEVESRVVGVHRRFFDLVASIARLPPRHEETEWWMLDELASAGFTLSFDVARMYLTLEIDPAVRLPRQHRMGRKYSLQEVTMKPEPYAGGINLYARTMYERDETIAAGSATPDYFFQLGPFLNVKDWVFEGEVRYDTVEEKPLELSAYRMVRDVPSRGLRFEAGTLRYPTIAAQGRRDILGLALSRRFEMDMARSPRQDTAEFFLDHGENVTVFLNDQRVFSEYLPPGSHVFEGIPFAPGRNELRVEAGGETQMLIIPHDADLLRDGLSDFSFAAGVLKDHVDSPAGSVFLRHGLTATWSAGAYTHLDEGTQMAGLESTTAYTIGSFQTTLSASRTETAWGETAGEERWGWGASLTYRLTVPSATVSSVLLSLNGRSPYYSSAGELEAENPYFCDAGSSLGIRLGRSSYASLGLRGRFAYDEDRDSVTLSVSGRTKVGKSLQLFIGVRSNLVGEELLGLQGNVTLTYYPQWKPNVRGSVTQAIGEETTTLSVSGDGPRSGSGLRWSAEAKRSAEEEQPYQLDDSLRYGGNRGELQFQSHVEAGASNYDPAYRLEGGLESALLFAGTTVAIGLPVRDSFILLRKHESLDDAIVGVRAGEAWSQRTGFLGPAVVGGYSSYRFQQLNIYAERVPSDVDVGNLTQLVYPPYRSGYVLTVGTGPAVYVGGILMDAAGEPVVLASGEARREGEAGMIRFFTDENGAFEIYGLKAGEWDLVLPRHGLAARLVIPSGTAAFLDVGPVRMEKP